jgi:hypothetical protein
MWLVEGGSVLKKRFRYENYRTPQWEVVDEKVLGRRIAYDRLFEGVFGLYGERHPNHAEGLLRIEC